jgi:hypothetical protein
MVRHQRYVQPRAGWTAWMAPRGGKMESVTKQLIATTIPEIVNSQIQRDTGCKGHVEEAEEDLRGAILVPRKFRNQ